jgi:ABC-type phosphate/phosphonate transport system substrate-binding protein
VTELLMGAVAYDPKVVTIWDGFRDWFRQHDLDFDYVLYSNYERQVDDLIDGRIDAAWNSPLAWVRARRRSASVRPLTMRDTDCDLTSVIVVAASSPITEVSQLQGKRIATGAIDSPQATLLPLDLLRAHGLDPRSDLDIVRFDVGVGLHGDHIGGEREAAIALLKGDADAACMIDGNHLLFSREGTLPAGSTRILAQTQPFDHCNMTVSADGPAELIERFGSLLLAMDYGDPDVRPLLDLEGLKQWRPGRTSGYGPLEEAVDQFGFYDPTGRITAAGYRP